MVVHPHKYSRARDVNPFMYLCSGVFERTWEKAILRI